MIFARHFNFPFIQNFPQVIFKESSCQISPLRGNYYSENRKEKQIRKMVKEWMSHPHIKQISHKNEVEISHNKSLLREIIQV